MHTQIHHLQFVSVTNYLCLPNGRICLPDQDPWLPKLTRILVMLTRSRCMVTEVEPQLHFHWLDVLFMDDTIESMFIFAKASFFAATDRSPPSPLHVYFPDLSMLWDGHIFKTVWKE